LESSLYNIEKAVVPKAEVPLISRFQPFLLVLDLAKTCADGFSQEMR